MTVLRTTYGTWLKSSGLDVSGDVGVRVEYTWSGIYYEIPGSHPDKYRGTYDVYPWIAHVNTERICRVGPAKKLLEHQYQNFGSHANYTAPATDGVPAHVQRPRLEQITSYYEHAWRTQ